MRALLLVQCNRSTLNTGVQGWNIKVVKMVLAVLRFGIICSLFCDTQACFFSFIVVFICELLRVNWWRGFYCNQ